MRHFVERSRKQRRGLPELSPSRDALFSLSSLLPELFLCDMVGSSLLQVNRGDIAPVRLDPLDLSGPRRDSVRVRAESSEAGRWGGRVRSGRSRYQRRGASSGGVGEGR